MTLVTIEPQKLITVMAVELCKISSKEIQDNVHVSKSVVSRHLLGERECIEIDLFVIEKIFGVGIKEFEIITK